jgi:hypothetical protein
VGLAAVRRGALVLAALAWGIVLWPRGGAPVGVRPEAAGGPDAAAGPEIGPVAVAVGPVAVAVGPVADAATDSEADGGLSVDARPRRTSVVSVAGGAVARADAALPVPDAAVSAHAAEAPTVSPAALLARALARRGLTVDDLRYLPAPEAEARRFLAQGGASPELKALLGALDEADYPDALVRARLDAAKARLRAARTRSSAAEVAALDRAYLDLETRFSVGATRRERQRIVATAAELGQ